MAKEPLLTFEEYKDMDNLDRRIYISKIIHILENSKMCFTLINDVLELASETILLNNVNFGYGKEKETAAT